jgi:hypothetical protein
MNVHHVDTNQGTVTGSARRARAAELRQRLDRWDGSNFLGLPPEIRKAQSVQRESSEWALGRVVSEKTFSWIKRKTPRKSWRWPCGYLWEFKSHLKRCPGYARGVAWRKCGNLFIYRSIAFKSFMGNSIRSRKLCIECRSALAPDVAARDAARKAARLSRLRQRTVDRLHAIARTVCEHCGTALTAERAARRFCGTRCRVAAHRQTKQK